jgi:stringent starvation protein B
MSLPSVVFTACYQHISTQGYKPHILVDTNMMTDDRLKPYARADGSIVLNIDMNAVKAFTVNENGIYVHLGFRGNSVHIEIPYTAIFSIYAHENITLGMFFSPSFQVKPTEPPVKTSTKPIVPPKKKPHLTLVKK